MSTTPIYQYPKPLPVRLGKTAGLFLGLSLVGYLFVIIFGSILKTGPELVAESIIAGTPLLLIAAGCAVAAVSVKVAESLRRSAA
jgi:hypothetical protein